VAARPPRPQPPQSFPLRRSTCAAIPETSDREEFVGHVRRRLPGAVADEKGALREAHRGTRLSRRSRRTSRIRCQRQAAALSPGAVVPRVGGNDDISQSTSGWSGASKSGTLTGKMVEGISGSTSTFASTSSRCSFPLAGSAARTYRRWPPTSSRRNSRRNGKPIAADRRRGDACAPRYDCPGNVRELEKPT